jgi:hypothetical protein
MSFILQLLHPYYAMVAQCLRLGDMAMRACDCEREDARVGIWIDDIMSEYWTIYCADHISTCV